MTITSTPEPLTETEQAERRALTHTAERGQLNPKTFDRLVELNIRHDATAASASGDLR